MSEIVPHPRAPEGRERQRQRDQAEEAALSAQREARRRDREREVQSAYLEVAMKKRPQMHSDAERRCVALNVWRLKERVALGPQRVSARAILEKIGRSKGSEDSTKRLPRFALEPGLPKEIEDKRAKELPKKIAPYTKFAIAAAELGKLDPNDTLKEILSGTRYLDDLPTISDDEMCGEIQKEIAGLIEDVAEHLDRKHGLRDYFKTIQAQHLVQRSGAAETEPLVTASNADWSTIRPGFPPLFDDADRFKKARLDAARAIALCPRLYIGTCLAHGDFAGIAVGQITFHDAGGREVFTTTTQAVEVTCQVTTDFEIALGPFGLSGAVTPLLVMRKVTRIKPSSGKIWAAPNATEWQIYNHETIGECSGRLHPAADDSVLSGEDRLLLKTESIHWSDGHAIATFSLVCDSYGRVAQHVATSAHKRAENVQFWEPEESLDLLPLWLGEIANAQPFLRHLEGPVKLFDVWTDERHGGTALKDHPLLDDTEGTRFVSPVIATEGTLLALLERWLRGDIRNCKRFDHCLEAEVEKAIARLQATKRLAHERLRAAIYGSLDAPPLPESIEVEDLGDAYL